MKVIDLLNKIANGETPNKIIYLPYATNNVYAGKYSYEQGDYLKDGWSNMWLFKDHLKAKLNDEVEILDEEEFEDIEELDVALLGQCDNWLRCPTNEVTKQDIELNPYIISNMRENTLEFQHKINSLIKNQKKIIENLTKNTKK